MRHPHDGSKPGRAIRAASAAAVLLAWLSLPAALANASELFRAPFLEYPVGLQPNAVTTGDFNEDGRIDAVFTSFYEPAFAVAFQDPGGTFSNATVHGVASFLRHVVSADFDGDGHLDLAVTNESDSLLVLLGDGTGDFPSSY